MILFSKVTGWRLWARRFALAIVSAMVAACLAIIFGGLLGDDLHQADVAVVLGNYVKPDGQPSLILQARLDHAVELYRQGYFKLVIVSGAHGKEGYDEPVVMRHYLETNGIPHDAIVEDNEGYTTWYTAKNTARFMQDHHLESVLIISQFYHMPRCRLAFSKFDLKTIYSSHAHYFSVRDFYSVLREVLGYPVYFFRPANATNIPAGSA